MKAMAILWGNPKNLSDKQLKISILIGCLMLIPMMVICLLKGFMQTNPLVDNVSYILTVWGWIRVIGCGNQVMNRKAKLLNENYEE